MTKITMNETRKGIIDTLKLSNEPLTLNEIAKIINVEKINSGTTNSLVSAGILKVAGTKKVAKTTYVEVNTYEIGDLSLLDQKDEKVKK